MNNNKTEMSLEEFQEEVSILGVQLEQHKVLLREATGTLGTRKLFATLNGGLEVTRKSKVETPDFPKDMELIVCKSMQPWFAMEAYYKIDIGEV